VSGAALQFDAVIAGYRRGGGEFIPVLREVSFTVASGEAYGLVGESGCGKSTAAFAAIGALPASGTVRGGRITTAGQDIASMNAAALRQLRGHDVAMVYQDPARALNPTLSAGRQIAEAFEILGASRRAALADAEALLGRLRIADAGRVMRAYPHELSGGLQQRVVIAMALAKRPKLLILDEPTTGLDAESEDAVLALLADLRRDYAAGMLFISHNLEVVGHVCDRVGILYAGALVEQGVAATVLRTPAHPYTDALLRCLPRGRARHGDRLATIPGALPDPAAPPPGCLFAPRCPRAAERCAKDPPRFQASGSDVKCHFPITEQNPASATSPAGANRSAIPRDDIAVLDVQSVSRAYGRGNARRDILRDISMSLRKGETVGLVGVSGGGKSTLARIILGLEQANRGEIRLHGMPLPAKVSRRSTDQTKAVRLIFQNPGGAFNRARRIRPQLARSFTKFLGLRGTALAEPMHAALRDVRLPLSVLDAKPDALSGGMKQRLAITAAFAGEPTVIVCDEPTSALDVSVQAAVLNLLADLQAEHGVSYLLISHDMGVVRFLADRIVRLRDGKPSEEKEDSSFSEEKEAKRLLFNGG
jgi:peptide/nickel transport system ATP-binding protein